MYRIHEIDGHDEEIAETLCDLHRLTFFDGAPIPAFDWGNWWLAYHETNPVAFAGLVPSTRARNAGYFSRVGVLKEHCGNGLQLRLMRAVEKRARQNGWNSVISDTTENIASANNFICAGYRLYQPSNAVGVAEHAILAQIHQLKIRTSAAVFEWLHLRPYGELPAGTDEDC